MTQYSILIYLTSNFTPDETKPEKYFPDVDKNSIVVLSIVKEYNPSSKQVEYLRIFDCERSNLDIGSSFLTPFNLTSGFTESLQSKLLRTHWFLIE